MAERGLGLRIHSRTLPVQGAEADLGMFLSKLAEERELTPAEMVSILGGQLLAWNKYVIRYERHGNYDHKADEA